MQPGPENEDKVAVLLPKVLVILPCLLLHGLFALAGGSELVFVGILGNTEGYCFGCAVNSGSWWYRTREIYLFYGLSIFLFNALCLIAMYVYVRGKWSVESGFIFWIMTIFWFGIHFVLIGWFLEN